jgi:hypothetical protein
MRKTPNEPHVVGAYDPVSGNIYVRYRKHPSKAKSEIEFRRAALKKAADAMIKRAMQNRRRGTKRRKLCRKK